jgi:hypothetical protein
MHIRSVNEEIICISKGSQLKEDVKYPYDYPGSLRIYPRGVVIRKITIISQCKREFVEEKIQR